MSGIVQGQVQREQEISAKTWRENVKAFGVSSRTFSLWMPALIMSRRYEVGWIIIFLFLVPLYGQAPSKQEIKNLKNQVFLLKTNIAAFGTPRYSNWDGRALYELEAWRGGEGEFWIGGNPDWKYEYFVSKRPFIVKESDLKKDGVEVKLHATDRNVGEELKLKIPTSQFREVFSGLFFTIHENTRDYENEVNLQLMSRYIAPKFDMTGVTEEEKLNLMEYISELGGGKPGVEARDEGAYLRVRVFDTNVYNTIQVNKNQRLASTLETMMKWARSRTLAAKLRAGVPTNLFVGFSFYWDVYYRNFLNEANANADSIELIVSQETFTECLEGELSVFEMVNASRLMVNDYKYTLTSYEPIGAVH